MILCGNTILKFSSKTENYKELRISVCMHLEKILDYFFSLIIVYKKTFN